MTSAEFARDDHEPYEGESLTGTAKPLCARCGSTEHLGPECPTLTATAGYDLDEDAEGSR